MLNKKSVDDINVAGKKVLVRCDFNVPLKDGQITDENRLVAALPTIKKLISDGGKVILCSHLGKPKGEPKPELSLAPVAVRLSELLGQEVKFAADDNVVGFPMVKYTDEELTQLTTLGTDIYKYVEAQFAHWVVDGGIDEEWDAYLKQLDSMGLQDLMNIQNGAYEAYLQSMGK
mgnify:FL=1